MTMTDIDIINKLIEIDNEHKFSNKKQRTKNRNQSVKRKNDMKKALRREKLGAHIFNTDVHVNSGKYVKNGFSCNCKYCQLTKRGKKEERAHQLQSQLTLECSEYFDCTDCRKMNKVNLKLFEREDYLLNKLCEENFYDMVDTFVYIDRYVNAEALNLIYNDEEEDISSKQKQSSKF